MAENVGAAVWEAGLDRAPLNRELDAAGADIAKAGAAQEKAATDSASRTVSKIGSMSRTAFVAVTQGAGALFAAATRGAVQMEDAVAQYRAATGASQQDAQAALASANRLAGQTTQSFDEVTATQIAIAKNFGLTGQALEDTTRKMLQWSVATGQDGVTAASNFTDILKAWDLTASDLPGIMDLLIASTQKFGGSVDQAQQFLQANAAQLQALGVSLQDGVGLLDLYRKAGLDADSATKGLTAAISHLKPGQTLDDLLAQISSIEDPLKRAQAAMDIFGKKAGTGLANALQPGFQSLADFIPAVGDVADATTKAADAIEGTFPEQIKKALNAANAEVRQFGEDFGPLLSGGLAVANVGASIAAALGLDKIIAAQFAKLAVGESLAAATASGTVLGTALATAAAVAVAAAPLVIAATVTVVVAPKVAALSPVTSGTSWWEKLLNINQPAITHGVVGVLEGVAKDPAVKGAAEKVAAVAAAAYDAAFTTGIQSRAAADHADDTAKALADQNKWIDANTNHVTANGSAVQVWLDQWFAWRDGVKETQAAARASFNATVASLQTFGSDIAGGLKSGRKAVEDAAMGLKWAINHPMAVARQEAWLEGQLNGKELARGLRSKNPEVRAAAENEKAVILDELAKLDPNKYGKDFGNKFASGLLSTGAYVSKNAGILANLVARNLKVMSPSKEGPFSTMGGPEGWGKHWGELYSKGLGSGLSGAFDDVPGFGGGYQTLAVGATSTVRHEHHTRMEFTVRDPDGGLARSGIGVNELAAALERGVRMSSVEHARAMDY